MFKILYSLLLISTLSYSQVMWTEINHTPERRATLEETLQQLKGDFTFNYFVKYLGPSLSPDIQSGSTFNRFKTGQDAKGDAQDYRGAHQTFYSFALGYNITSDINLNFTHTYQYDENNNTEYEYVGWDGNKYTDTRQAGNTYNNQRINLNVRNIINNETLYLNTNFYYEIPSTEVAQNNEMLYGVGFATTLGFYNKTPGLSYGLSFMLERDVYPDDEYYPDWCKQAPYTCDGVIPERRQTLRAGLGPWLGYMLNDKYSLAASINFDWDQDGDQVRTRNFNANMDDLASISLNYNLNRNLTLTGGVEASITEIELERTAIFGALNLRL
jgi:hypothetical protein